MAPSPATVPPPPKPESPPVGLPGSDEPDEEVEILDVGKAVKKKDESDLVVVPQPQYSAANSQEAPQVPESPETVAIPQAEVPKGQKTEAQRLAEQRLIFEEEKRKSKESAPAHAKNVYLPAAGPGGIEDLEEEILRDVQIPSPSSAPAVSKAVSQPTAFARPAPAAMSAKGGQDDDAYEELMDMILDELQDVSVK
jgi:hypothetical protein